MTQAPAAAARLRSPRRKHTLTQQQNIIGWLFIIPAAALIAYCAFYPMVMALLQSFQTGKGATLQWPWESGKDWLYNYNRMFKDAKFLQSLKNCFLFLIIQVPVMLLLAMWFASMLNRSSLKMKGILRTCIFLPCATSLVSCSVLFRAMFDANGIINIFLMKVGILTTPYQWLAHTWSARLIIIIVLLWRWTGYNMIFFLAGLQNLDYSTYEAASLDGATKGQTFWHITVPQLRPIIILTAIMSTNGTLQLFDEIVNITNGAPGYDTLTMSVYIYNLAFRSVPQFGYICALANVILLMVAILSVIQLKVGDKRD